MHDIEERIEAGDFRNCHLDDVIILELQQALCADLVPDLAGWRRHDVQVGQHTPPEFYRVPVLMREYASDLAARLEQSGGVSDVLLETLAFAEGRLLFIHPFADFNGRVTGLFLRELLRRQDIPAMNLAPEPAELESYLAALRAADDRRWLPLMDIWRCRLEAAAGTLFPESDPS